MNLLPVQVVPLASDLPPGALATERTSLLSPTARVKRICAGIPGGSTASRWSPPAGSAARRRRSNPFGV